MAAIAKRWRFWLRAILKTHKCLEVAHQQIRFRQHHLAFSSRVTASDDIDGDGKNDVVGVQEGDTSVGMFRAPDWKRATLFSFEGPNRFPRADDFKLADVNGDGKLDVGNPRQMSDKEYTEDVHPREGRYNTSQSLGNLVAGPGLEPGTYGL